VEERAATIDGLTRAVVLAPVARHDAVGMTDVGGVAVEERPRIGSGAGRGDDRSVHGEREQRRDDGCWKHPELHRIVRSPTTANRASLVALQPRRGSVGSG
jgi:hypothetical protein